VSTATGYDVAWELPGANQYVVWSTDGNGNFLTNSAVLSGSSATLKSYELVFNQDLNGDGVVGPIKTVIQTDTNSFGATSLVAIGNDYYLGGSGGSGPELLFGGAAVTAGQFGGWVPFGAVPTATGYDVAWELPGANQYVVWSTDANGNFLTNSAVLPGTSTTLESYELVFNQDLNGDGAIDTLATTVNASGDVVIGLSLFKQAATIAAGATLELAGADTGSVTFAGSTGTLKLDNSLGFSGPIAGQLAVGDVIDLTDITAGAGATIGYTGNNSPGTLTVGDGTHTASIKLLGNYSLANFIASSDGHNGTSVIDPPISGSVAPVATPADSQVAVTSVAARTEYATVASVTAATIAPPIENIAFGSGMSVPVALPVSPTSLEDASSIVRSLSVSSVTPPTIFAPSSSGLVAPKVETRDDAVLPVPELPQSAIAREIVSPDDVILAIRRGDIAFKIDMPADTSSERSPWLFDEELGTFQAPTSEPLTIFVEGEGDDGILRTPDGLAAAFTGEAVVLPDQSWFGAIRMALMQPSRIWWWR
jgi:hypothetical protein